MFLKMIRSRYWIPINAHAPMMVLISLTIAFLCGRAKVIQKPAQCVCGFSGKRREKSPFSDKNGCVRMGHYVHLVGGHILL